LIKLAFAYVRVGGGGFLLAVWVFWLQPAVLAFVLLGRLLLGHSVIYGGNGTTGKQTQAGYKISSNGDENRRNR
jgi:hypothetical protein